MVNKVLLKILIKKIRNCPKKGIDFFRNLWYNTYREKERAGSPKVERQTVNLYNAGSNPALPANQKFG